MDVMAALAQRKDKALGKVSRAEKALESANKELADVIAAERVMGEITGTSVESKAVAGAPSERDKIIARLIPAAPSPPMSPAELYPIYVEETGDPIELEAFRTAVWRLKKKTIRGTEKSWVVKAEDGKYWREPVADGLDDDPFGEPDDDPFDDPFK